MKPLQDLIAIKKAFDLNPDASVITDIHIRKAYEANQGITDIGDLRDGAALGYQQLDTTMASIVATDEEFKTLRSLPRETAEQTMIEWNKKRSHGDNPYRSNSVGQSQDPSFVDAFLSREYEFVSFFREGFKYNRVIAQTKNVANPEDVESTSALMRILVGVSRNLFHGNRSVDPYQMNGLVTQIESLGDSDHIVDCRGKIPDPQLVADKVALIRRRYFAYANKMFVPIGTKSLIDQSANLNGGSNQNTYVFYNANQNGANVTQGRIVEGLHASQAYNSKILYDTDRWIDESDFGPTSDWDRDLKQYVEKVVGDNPPGTPSIAVAVQAPSVPGSKWAAGDAGVIGYRVIAHGEGGSSLACNPVTGTVAANGALSITITAGSGVTIGYTILRETGVGTGIYRKIKTVKKQAVGNTVFLDLNEDLPGTGKAVLGDFNARGASGEYRTISLSELLPPLKTTFPPGVGGLVMFTGMIEYYLALKIVAPEKFILFKNLPVNG